MSSFIVKGPSTSYKLLRCCRARQATRRRLRARGGGFVQGHRSSLGRPAEIPTCASQSLLCLEDFSGVSARWGRGSLCIPSRAPRAAPAVAWVGTGENFPSSQLAAQVVTGVGKAQCGRWGRETARMVAVKGIYYCSAGRCGGCSAASVFRAAPCVGEMGSGMAPGVLPAGLNVSEHPFLRLAPSARFPHAKPDGRGEAARWGWHGALAARKAQVTPLCRGLAAVFSSLQGREAELPMRPQHPARIPAASLVPPGPRTPRDARSPCHP